MTDSIQAEWLRSLQEAVSASPAAGADDLLTRQLSGYRCLLDAWEEGLHAGLADPCTHALHALARHAQGDCLRQIHAWLSPGPGWDAVIRLPLPAIDPLADALAFPGATQTVALWRAVVNYQRQVDRFCALYEFVGAQSLARLEAWLEASTAPPIETVVALYALWQVCQDACEAAIVQDEQYAPRLADVTLAAAALRMAYRRWLGQFPGVPHDSGALRALSEEIAQVRRQLRAMTGQGRGAR